VQLDFNEAGTNKSSSILIYPNTEYKRHGKNTCTSVAYEVMWIEVINNFIYKYTDRHHNMLILVSALKKVRKIVIEIPLLRNYVACALSILISKT
jgi:hypothetical protein